MDEFSAERPAIFRALVGSAPDGIVVVDQAGRIVLVNQQTERLFGYVQDELLKQGYRNSGAGTVMERHTGHRTSYLQHAQLRPMGSVLDLRKAQGRSEFPIEISLRPIEGSRQVAGVGRDPRRHRPQASRAEIQSTAGIRAGCHSRGNC
jgi:PAS domain S-box-containing protein